MAEAEAGGQKCDVRRRGPDPDWRTGVATGHGRQLPPPSQVPRPGTPPSFRIDYLCGLSPYAEYVSFERQGYARTCAERWWYALGASAPVPVTVDEALQRQHELDPVVVIAVVRNGRFWNVTDRRVWRPDGSVVEIDRYHRCWVIETRADAARALAATPINDAILF